MTRPVHYIAPNFSSQLLTNLPLHPQVMPAPVAGDRYPNARAISRISHRGDGLGTQHPTWVAQDTGGGWYQVIFMAGGFNQSAANYYICDPASVDWGSVVLTGLRPQNPIGGRNAYFVSVGTAKLKNGATVMQSETAYHRLYPHLVGNSFISSFKTPPICFSQTSGGLPPFGYSTSPLDWKSYGIQTGFFFPVAAKLVHWLGGDLVVSRIPRLMDGSVTVYPVDPGTLEAQVSSGVNLGNVVAGTARTFTTADLLAAGLVRWDFFFITSSVAPGPFDDCIVYLQAPLDLPPPYDAPGWDVPLIKGGYLP